MGTLPTVGRARRRSAVRGLREKRTNWHCRDVLYSGASLPLTLMAEQRQKGSAAAQPRHTAARLEVAVRNLRRRALAADAPCADAGGARLAEKVCWCATSPATPPQYAHTQDTLM